MSGPEMQREKERVAQRMREKQAAGMSTTELGSLVLHELVMLTKF
jgi:hypothetical protein